MSTTLNLTFTKFFTVLMFILAVSAAIIVKLSPYLVNNYDFLVGFDTGKYLFDLKTGVSTSRSSLDLWVEPGLNTTLTAIQSLVQLKAETMYQIILPVYVSIILGLIVFLFTRRLTQSNLAGIFATFYLASSFIFLNATFDSFYRQIFSSIIFMVFLYFLTPFYTAKRISVKSLILFSLLGAGIIFSHRAISLLYGFTIGILVLLLIKSKQIHKIKDIFIIFSGSLGFSAAYWIPLAIINLAIMRDTIIFSIERKAGGERIIKSTTRSDNQLIGYMKTVISSFLPIIGITYMAVKKTGSISLFLTLWLIVYIFIKAVFSNRFIFNLELLLAISSGLAFHYLRQKFKLGLLLLLSLGILSLNMVKTVDAALSRKPYVEERTEAIDWVESHIDKHSAIIFAPDALATILTSLGYRTSTYEYPLKGDTRITNTEQFLSNGYRDLTLTQNVFTNYKDIYVIFGDWNLSHPFSRTNGIIPLDQWDSSMLAEKMYEGDSYIRRVYKINQ